MKVQGTSNQRFLFAVTCLIVGMIGWLLYLLAPNPSLWRIVGYSIGLGFSIAGTVGLGIHLVRTVQFRAHGELLEGFRFAVVFLIVGMAGWILYISAPFLTFWRIVGLVFGGIFTIGGILVLGIYVVRSIQPRR